MFNLLLSHSVTCPVRNAAIIRTHAPVPRPNDAIVVWATITMTSPIAWRNVLACRNAIPCSRAVPKTSAIARWVATIRPPRGATQTVASARPSAIARTRPWCEPSNASVVPASRTAWRWTTSCSRWATMANLCGNRKHWVWRKALKWPLYLPMLNWALPRISRIWSRPIHRRKRKAHRNSRGRSNSRWRIDAFPAIRFDRNPIQTRMPLNWPTRIHCSGRIRKKSMICIRRWRRKRWTVRWRIH